jgi:hypothetical protein
MSTLNFYEILGVATSATPEQIRAAHRAQSRQYHPDTAPDRRGDPARFAQIQEAYETLSVPDFRRRYDTKYFPPRETTAARVPRRPPKSPCGACQKPVYASQLILFLGRYMCKTCVDRRIAREARRPRLSGLAELRWQLRRVGVWAQSHLATIVVVLLALGAAGARLAWVGHHGNHPDRGGADTTTPESTNGTAGGTRQSGTSGATPETADIGPTNPPGK